MPGLDEKDEELLQLALATSFTRLPEPPPPPSSEPAPERLSPPEETTSTSAVVSPAQQQPEVSTGLEDSWQEQYNRQVAQWRAESAIAREKAERTRAEWEERRKAEAEEEAAVSKKKESTLSGWETVSPADETLSQKVVNEQAKRPLVAGVSSGGAVAATSDTAEAVQRVAIAEHILSGEVPKSGPKASSTSKTQDEFSGASEEEDAHISRIGTWEEIHSLASSFPSLPENISPSTQDKSLNPPDSPVHHHHHHHHRPHRVDERHSRHHQHHPHSPQAASPPTVTSAIFNSNLPPQTRALALLSSIAINMFLPFVNGVMLGFGEIFARNVIGPYFGWKPPGNVGIRAAAERRRGRETRWFS